MNLNIRRKATLSCVLSVLLLGMAMPSMAAGQSDQWEFGGEIFLWGAGVEGLAATGEEIDVPLHDVLDSLDAAFMGTLAARKDKWTLFADLIYLDIGENAGIPLNLPSQTIQGRVNVDLKQYISTFGVAYRIAGTDRSSLSLLAGGRFNDMDLDLDYDFSPLASGRVSRSGNTLDFIVGARGQVDLNEKWYFHYYADVGWGDSDRTWQAIAGINYRFSKVDATLGYASLDWDFDNKSLIREMKLSGPYVGIKFGF